MSQTRKTRSDSKLDNLPENQREALERWLFDDSPRLSCAEACKHLYDDFNVSSSETAVRSFYKRAQQERRMDNALNLIADGAKSANAVLEATEQNAANFRKVIDELVVRLGAQKALMGEELTIEELCQLAAMSVGGRKEDREDRKLDIKLKELRLAERKEAREEAKAKATQAVEETAKGGKIDAATKRELLEAIDKKLLGA